MRLTKLSFVVALIGTSGVEGIECACKAAWSSDAIYVLDDQVSYGGFLWTSQWWTKGDTPVEAEGKPWKHVGECTDVGKACGETDTTTGAPATTTQAPATTTQAPATTKNSANIDTTTQWCIPRPSTTAKGVSTENQASDDDLWHGTVVAPQAWPKRVYAPYTDGGLYPYAPLTKIAKDTGVKHFVLAFLTIGDQNTITGCTPAYAGVIDYRAGPTAWDTDLQGNRFMYDEIMEIRAMGGDVMLSFGGAVGTELADSAVCQQEADVVEALVTQYSNVIDLLNLSHIDFDIEGGAISSVNRETGWKYRNEAIKKLGEKYPELKVFYTLPVLPSGLTADGVQFVTDLVTGDVPMHLINVMTMDYGDAGCPTNDMYQCEQDAIENLVKQVYDIIEKQNKLDKYSVTSIDDVYSLVGSTPMIGMNDVTTEFYTVQNAKDSIKVWNDKNLAFVGQWSINRDLPCEKEISYVDTGCSGAPDQTSAYEFASVLNGVTSSD